MERTILQKYYTNIVEQKVHQYLVRLKDTGYPAMILFVTEEYFESQAYQTFLQHLQAMYYNSTEDETISVILINEEQNLCALLAFAFGERLNVNVNPKWFELNNENMEMLNSIVKSAYGYICMLPMTMIGIIREISIVLENNLSLSFVYRRDFDKAYKMNTLRNRSDAQRLLYRTPEEEYPYDSLDHIILSFVKLKFPNAKVTSKTLLFNTQLRDEQRMKQYAPAEVTINISPLFNSPGNTIMAATRFGVKIRVEAYSYFSQALGNINGSEWVASYSFNDFKILTQQISRYKPYSSVFL